MRPSIALAAGLAAAAVVPWTGARAQWIGAMGEDALVLPRGVLRVSVQGVNASHDERYTATAEGRATGARVPLGVELSGDPLGAAQVPALATLRTALRAITGLDDVDVSVGRLAVRADARRSEIPVRLDLGVGRRLQLTATVPYVQTRVAVRVTGDPTAEQAAVGLNPALLSPEAAATNGALVDQLRAAADELRTRLEGCDADPTALACSERAAAESLNESVERFASGVVAVYGTAEAPGSAFVPVRATAAADGVEQRVAAFRDAYQRYAVGTIAEGAVPVGAAGGAPPEVLRAALGGGPLGPGLGELGEARRYGVGDVELGARFRLLDPFGGDPRARAAVRGLLVRASVGALVRLGTGTPDDPLHLLDVGTGDGQHDVEVQLAADVLAGRRLAGSVVARYGVQLADELDVLLPEAGFEDGYPTATNLYRVRRDLGDYLEVELAPRYALTELVAVGAHYRFRSKGADTYELPLVPPTSPAARAEPTALGTGTESRQHMAGIGVVLSTLPVYARGGTRVPVEVSYRHARTIAGAGRLTPHGSRDELTLRVYLDLFGGR